MRGASREVSMIRNWIWTVVLVCLVRPGFAVTIDKLLPFTPETDAVRIQVGVTGDADAVKVELTGTITPVGSKTAVWTGEIGTADASAKTPATVEKLLEKLSVKPWSPGAPSLYELTVVARAGGKEVATKTVRFGFRKVERGNGQFLLNGKPIFLRGIAINPPGRTVPEAVGESRQFAHDYVKYLRGQNVNLIRLEHDNQDWFDVCDELGMMVYQGFYGSPPKRTKKDQQSLADQDEAEGKVLPKDFEDSMAAYEERFETYVHHPSIVVYILTNEMPYKGKTGEQVHEFLTRAYDRLSKWDHTRLYIGNAGYGEGRQGDINDVHRYWGWYYNTFLTYYNLRDPKLFGEFDKNQPFTFSECVGNFTGPTGAYNYIERKQLAAALGWSSHAPDQPKAAQAYQAFMVKQAAEIFRRTRFINPRMSGLMPFTITFHNWRGIKSFAEMKPTAASVQFGVSYQPVLLSFENWKSQVYAGTKTTLLVHVVNDADDFSDLTDGTLAYELKDSTGAVALSGNAKLPAVPYYGTHREAIALDLPPSLKTGQYNLVGTVRKGESVVSSNETPLFVAGSEWNEKQPAPKLRVTVYDPGGKTEKALEKLGIKFAKLNAINRLEPGGLLIIGEEAWAGNADDMKKLTAFVRAGGRVLCLGQKHSSFNASWLPGGVKLSSVSVNDPEYMTADRPAYDQMHVNPERPDHPVFAGVDREQLKLWSDYTDWNETKPEFPRVYPVRFGYKLTKPEDLAKVAVLADYDRGLEGIALAEFFDGKGSVLLSAFDIIPRVGLDPIADRMLANMIAYMGQTESHPVHPTVTGPIKWGDFATEKGVIGSPVYGLFRNCDWVAPPTEPDAKPLTDAQGGWNTRPSDQFLPAGVRPRGPFTYTFNCAPRDADKNAETGTGVFYATIPAGRNEVVTVVENPTQLAASLQVDVNDVKSKPVPIEPGKTITIRTPIKAKATNVGVRYSGHKELIIRQTSFEEATSKPAAR